MIPRLKVGKGVSGAVRYVLSEGKDRTGVYRTEPKGEASRVAWTTGLNLGFEIETAADADLARRIMEFDAANQNSRTKQCEKDCVHLSLGWRKGEQPTRAQMEEAARGALASLGMENAKAIIVAHTDEPYAHIHIVASKINPTTGRAYDLKRDRLKLSAWAQKYEEKHNGGIVCLRRAEANQLRAAIDGRDAAAVLALLTQQRATFKPADLERALAKQIKPALQRAQFGNEVLALPEVVRLAEKPGERVTRYTTRAILQAEGQVTLAGRALVRSRRHGVNQETCRRIVRQPEYRTMSDEQLMAFVRATDAGGLVLIDGQAGTGKSYTMAAIRAAYEAEGFAVIGLAPTNAVAQDMRAAGFAYANTIHAELFKQNNRRVSPWNSRTVLMVDEAAMIDTQLMAQLMRRAEESGTKVILVGDDRQLSSIDRGGMFGALKDEHGAAPLSEVRRQQKQDDRRASELMAEGNFSAALAIYQDKGAVHWQHNTEAARDALVEQWAKDSAADPSKLRFVFAYTNDDVDWLNSDLRQVRQERGELGQGHRFDTKHGPAEFAAGDRLQLTGTDKRAGLNNGAAGTVENIDGQLITVQLDGRKGESVTIDAAQFQDFRHGYAGTIYKGQGRTLDQTYLYHSEHWKASSGYVALTRHRDKTEIYVSRDVVEDLPQLARQMGRVDDRRAASRFHQPDGALEIERTPTAELPRVKVEREAAHTPAPAVEARPAPGPATRPAESTAAPAPAADVTRKAEAAPYVPVHPTLPRSAPAAPTPTQETGQARPTPAPAPEVQGPREWAQSAGMTAQQASALREAARVERAQVQAHGPMAPMPASKPRVRVPAGSAPASPAAAPGAPAPTAAPTPAARPEAPRVAEAAQPGAARPTSLTSSPRPPGAAQDARATSPHSTSPTPAKTAPAPAIEAGEAIPTPAPAPVAQTRPEPAPPVNQPTTAPAPRSVPLAPEAAREVRPPQPVAGPAQTPPERATVPRAAPAASAQPTPPQPAPVAPAAVQAAQEAKPPASAARPATPGEVSSRPLTADEVQNRFGDPALQARYQQEAQRHTARQQGTQAEPPETRAAPAGSANAPAEKRAESQAAQRKEAERKRFEELMANFNEAGRERTNPRERSGGRGGRRR